VRRVPAWRARLPVAASVRTVTLAEPGSPFVAFNVWVKAGSQNDPKGKEGLAALTASLMAEGSTTGEPVRADPGEAVPDGGRLRRRAWTRR
jgi:predicted Zn-dependent peptidase